MTALTVASVALLYAVCAIASVRWYGKKLDKLEDQLIKERGIDFDTVKVATWLSLVLFFWWIVLPYELATHFRRWQYPHCQDA